MKKMDSESQNEVSEASDGEATSRSEAEVKTALPETTWLSRTGQQWKLWFCGALGLPSIYFFVSANQPGFGFLFILPSALLHFTFIQCPKCNKSVMWKLANSVDQRELPWRVGLLQECPCCGFDARSEG